VQAPAYNGGRILASPKARWLAHQEGLDLERLAEHGVNQPFHVADLETLRTLPSAGATGQTAGMAAQAALHVEARVPASGFADFMAWREASESGQTDARFIWARFAAGALRQTIEAHDDPVAVETRSRRSVDGCFGDADHARLSTDLAESENAPDLIIRDFTDTAITSASSAASEAPVLTIGRDGDDYRVTLDYRGEQLSEDAAFSLVDGFASRLADPLHHIL
jgi:pyruvate dehydrogenase E2 component (dihydrolipoamide acetyltransferase)/2-oxoglutarate dehydrogenase E2 component (dihydrolipoamide succinyltransferase)